MTTFNIHIEGLDKFIAALNQSPEIVKKYLNNAIRKSIIDIQSTAVPVTPIDTGRLRSSYEIEFGDLRGSTGPTAEYAIYVHEGTRYMKGRPFLKQALDNNVAKIEQTINSQLNQALEEIARKSK